MFSVVPELYFAMKGGSLKENNPLTISKSTLRLYSIEMPVLARLHCNKLYLNAGPYVGYNFGGRMKTEGSGTVPETSTKVSFGNSSSDLQTWDLWRWQSGYNCKSDELRSLRWPFWLRFDDQGEAVNVISNLTIRVVHAHRKTRADS
jgi:hypothetical protein